LEILSAGSPDQEKILSTSIQGRKYLKGKKGGGTRSLNVSINQRKVTYSKISTQQGLGWSPLKKERIGAQLKETLLYVRDDWGTQKSKRSYSKERKELGERKGERGGGALQTGRHLVRC